MFLCRVKAEETLRFCLAVEGFRMVKEEDKLKPIAEAIWKKFISPEGNNQVNLPGPVQEELRAKLNQPNSELFDAAQLQIWSLLEEDKFYSFLRSQEYQMYLQNEVGLPKERKPFWKKLNLNLWRMAHAVEQSDCLESNSFI